MNCNGILQVCGMHLALDICSFKVVVGMESHVPAEFSVAFDVHFAEFAKYKVFRVFHDRVAGILLRAECLTYLSPYFILRVMDKYRGIWLALAHLAAYLGIHCRVLLKTLRLLYSLKPH